MPGPPLDSTTNHNSVTFPHSPVCSFLSKMHKTREFALLLPLSNKYFHKFVTDWHSHEPMFCSSVLFPLSSSKEQLSPIKMLGLGRGSGSHYLHCQADAEHTQSICAMNGHVWGFLQIPSLRLAPIWPQLCKHWGGDGIFWWERSMDLCFPNPESNKGKSVLRGYKRNPQANMHFPAP